MKNYPCSVQSTLFYPVSLPSHPIPPRPVFPAHAAIPPHPIRPIASHPPQSIPLFPSHALSFCSSPTHSFAHWFLSLVAVCPRLVSILASFVLVIKHSKQKQPGEKRFPWFTFPRHNPSLRQIRKGIQGRRLRQILEEWCLLDCFLIHSLASFLVQPRSRST